MGKTGRGLLMIAADVPAEHEAEVNDWYDREHLEERVAITGFIAARRYRALDAARRYLALYETESLAVLDGAEYRQRLANQTERSKRALGTLRGMHRAVARFAAGRGAGVGGCVAVIRLGGAPSAAPVDPVLAALVARPGILAAHLLAGDARLSQPLPEARPSGEPLAAPGDWFLLLEATEAECIWAAESVWSAIRPDGDRPRRLGTWSLIASLARGDL